MKDVPFVCRLCNKPGTASAPDTSTPEEIVRWHRMLCHDFCHDIRTERQRLEDKINRSCAMILVLNGSEDAAQAKMLPRLRLALVEITKAWARNECRWMGSRAYHWSDEIVNALIEMPDKWPACMRNARDFIRLQVREAQGQA